MRSRRVSGIRRTETSELTVLFAEHTVLLDKGVVVLDGLLVLNEPARLLRFMDRFFERALDDLRKVESQGLGSLHQIDSQRQVRGGLACARSPHTLRRGRCCLPACGIHMRILCTHRFKPSTRSARNIPRAG